MGIEILKDEKSGHQCMYCNTTMWAFGGVFDEDEPVQDFIDWLPEDPRGYTDRQLEKKIAEWRNPDEQPWFPHVNNGSIGNVPLGENTEL